MRNLVFTGITALLFGQGALAQVPTISASQYIITVQGSQSADYDYLHNVWYSMQYGFYDANSTLTSNLYGYGNSFYQQMYVTEVKKPVRVMATYKVSYDYWYCESYNDPYSDCQFDPYDVRQAKNKKEKPGQTAGAGSGSKVAQLPPCENCWWYPSYFYSFYNDIPLRYPSYDTTINQYGSSVTITVRPAGDQNYNLPSSDNVSIKAEGDLTDYTWQYQVLGTGTDWLAVPSSLIQPGGSELILKGESLFGWNWMSYINKTVIFRLRKSTGTTSNILIYTHRLSSPRITSVSAVQNPCFGDNKGYIHVQFNRMLMENERLNIFLKDTTLGLDYSALNITNAQINSANNVFSWPQQELVQGNYKVSLIGKYFDYATYTGSVDHFNFVKIQDPELVRFFLSQQPVLCYDGNSGKIVIAAKGGVGGYKYQIAHPDSAFDATWYDFNGYVPNPVSGTSDKTHAGVTAQSFKIRVRDANNCQNRDSVGNEITKVIQVRQPAEPLHVALLNVSPITAYNQSNGAIKVRLAGGTMFAYSVEIPNYRKYQFEWRDSATNTLINTYTLDTAGKFEINIANLPEGTYTLKAWDASYGLAPSYNQQGCIINMNIRMSRPLPLNVNVITTSPIKCNGETNAQLKAIATGGIPVTTDSTIYNFTWYKQNGASFTNLNVNDSVLRDIGAGSYKVEIRDRYNNLKESNLFNLGQPNPLSAVVNTTPASCYFTRDATMTALPAGGTSPYSYEWSTGDLTDSVDSVAGGQYLLVVKDANLCQITKQVTVTSPGKINTVQNITPVACNGTSSGAIQLTPSGGAGGYTYTWSTGSTASGISNLPAGTYNYKITDAAGCFDTDTLTLTAPEAYTVTAGADRKICIGQTIRLTANVSATTTPLTVSWSGPAGTLSGQSVNVNTAGTYIVTVSSPSGCQKKDTVVVAPENATVNTGFTVSTQVFAGEKTMLVNISPLLQDSADWILPPNSGITLVNQTKSFCELNFADTGHFVVGIRAYYSNGCIDEKYKDVNVVRKEGFVNTGNQTDAFLKQFGLYPNPTSGSFTLSLVFNSVTPARVRVINILTNTTISDKMLIGASSYTEPYNIGVQPAGTYVVVIETPKGNYVHKLNKL